MQPPSLFAEQVERFRSDLDALVGEAPFTLGVAVSGGPDSLALLLLSKAALDGNVRAATVDHGLRAEAPAEAAFVHDLCRDLGIEHDILRPLTPIKGNLQSVARQARYRLLEQWRDAHGLAWVATGHHADDQAETVLLRLNRGSGVAGLAGVRKVNGSIVRPLLGWRRLELEQLVDLAGLEPVQDPSNADDRFDRARLRHDLKDASWIDPLALARSAEWLAEAEESLEWSSDRLWAERWKAVPGGFSLDVAQLPSELRRRLVRRAIDSVCPDRQVRGGDLSRFISTLETGNAATLAGVKGKGGNLWLFSLAPLRRAQADRALPCAGE